MNSKYKVFIDFDGTIAVNDVGYEMFRKFTDGASESVVAPYRKREITSHECLSAECRIWNEKRPIIKDVLDFIDSRPLDPGFDSFVEYAGETGIELCILSEGFDFYINRILDKNGYEGIERITNIAEYQNGLLLAKFPYFRDGCGQCSNCKGYHIRRLSHPRQSTVFIGDGHSDAHAAENADIVFAKSFLAEHLDESGRFYYEYEDFNDVLRHFREILEKRIFLANKGVNLCFQMDNHGAALPEVRESKKGTSRLFEQRERIIPDNSVGVCLAVEDGYGRVLGEARLAPPDDLGVCRHYLELFTEYSGRRFARQVWLALLRAAANRWPEARTMVTPSTENNRAIKLYQSLGFETEEVVVSRCQGPNSETNVRFLRMTR